MTSEWKYRINVIIPADQTATKNALWTIIAPGGDAEALSFGVPLSKNGKEPATHSGISTAATEEMRLLATELLRDELADAIISVQDYRLNDWDDLLKANGLQVVQTEII